MATARRRTVAVVLLAALGGCAPYVSTYRPPVDGRARVVWSQGEMVVEPSGLVLTPSCGAAIRALTGYASMPVAAGRIDLPVPVDPRLAIAAAEWRPIYYGDPIVAQPGYGPTYGMGPPMFFWVPGLYWDLSPARHGVHNGIGAGVSLPIVPPGGHGGGIGSLGGGGGGGGGDDAAVVAAVILAATLPIADVALAASSPISRKQAARATDLVAAWNDLARTPGSPCAMPGGAEPLPPEALAPPTGPAVP